jgi:hypothetical protein
LPVAATSFETEPSPLCVLEASHGWAIWASLVGLLIMGSIPCMPLEVQVLVKPLPEILGRRWLRYPKRLGIPTSKN